tara:strand:- start:1333 stop:2799 length:1467 start_codon:yes stop_codon:yes gene_type:complete
MENYDNFDLDDIVQKRNDVIDLKQNLQKYVQRLRKHETNLAIKERYVLKGGFFSGITSIISPFIRNIIKILSPVIGLLPGGGNILKVLENLNIISSKFGQLEKTFESWEEHTKLNKALFGKFKKMCFLLNKSLKLFVFEKIEIDTDTIEIAQIIQKINALQSEMKELKEQGMVVLKKGDMIGKEQELDKLKLKLIELQLKLSKLVEGKDLKKEIEKLKNLATDPQAILSEAIKMAIMLLPLPGMALIPKIQMITQDILRAEELLMDILDTTSDIVFSQSICPDDITYLTDKTRRCKFIGDDLYDEAIGLKALLFLVESEKGKAMLRSLDPHYQSIRHGNIKDGDDILKLLINLLIRFIRHGKTEEIIKLLKNPDTLAKFKSLKEILIKFEEFPYKWPMGIKVQDYIFDILKGVIDQDKDMQQFFVKIANQLSGSPKNLETLIQMLLDNQGIKKNEGLENVDGGGKKPKKRNSRKRIKGKKKGKYTRKR